MINFDDFAKVEMKVGQIKEVVEVEGSDKLLKLTVDFAEKNPRTVLSGIKKFFPEFNRLIGVKCVFVTNFEPRPIMGMESQAMIMTAHNQEEEGKLSLLLVDENASVGAVIR